MGALIGQTGLGIAPLMAMTAGKLVVIIIQPTGDTSETPALVLLTVLYALLYEPSIVLSGHPIDAGD